MAITNLHDKLWEQAHGTKPVYGTSTVSDKLLQMKALAEMQNGMIGAQVKPPAPTAAPMSPVPKAQQVSNTLAMQADMAAKQSQQELARRQAALAQQAQPQTLQGNPNAPVQMKTLPGNPNAAPQMQNLSNPAAGAAAPENGQGANGVYTPSGYGTGEYTPIENPGYVSEADAYAQAMAQLQAQMQQIMSPEYFQQTLQQIMSSYQPLIDANTQQIGSQFTEYRRQADVDADRRGMFMSGAAGENQRKLNEGEATQVNQMRAELQARASEQASNSINQQLQAALGMGELGAKYAGLAQEDKQFAATLDMNYDKMNLEQKNFFEELGFKKEMHANEQKNFYDNLQAKYYELDQQQKQFMEEMGFKRQQLVSQERIAGMQYSASKAAAASNNEIALAKLAMEQARFEDEQSFNAAQAEYQRLSVEQDAFDKLNTDLMGVKEGSVNWDTLLPKYSAYQNPAYGDLYDRLYSTMMTTASEIRKTKEAEATKKNSNGVLGNLFSGATGNRPDTTTDAWKNYQNSRSYYGR